MSKLEYLNPSDWSLHVIDGENECVPDGWVLVPEGKNVAYKCNVDNVIYFTKLEMGYRDFDLVWTRKMKEYLVERDGKYELVEAYHLDGGIEVPDGSDEYKSNGKFYKDNGKYFYSITNSWFLSEYFDFKILWQRKPSLNDQYAETEEVRQDSNVNNPKHYTSHPSGIECIEITRHHDFAIGNAIKYLWRAGLKDSDNEIQDLEKAAWYIQDKIKQLRGGK